MLNIFQHASSVPRQHKRSKLSLIALPALCMKSSHRVSFLFSFHLLEFDLTVFLGIKFNLCAHIVVGVYINTKKTTFYLNLDVYQTFKEQKH